MTHSYIASITNLPFWRVTDFFLSFLTHKRHILAVLHQAADNNPCVWNKEIAKLLGLFVIFSLLQLKSGCSRFQNPLKPVLLTVCSLLCLWPWAKACGSAGRVKSYHSSFVRAALGLQSFRLKCIYFNSFGLGGSFLPCRYNSDQSLICLPCWGSSSVQVPSFSASVCQHSLPSASAIQWFWLLSADSSLSPKAALQCLYPLTW